MRLRRIADRAWGWLGHDGLLLPILGLLIISTLIPIAFPQSPVPVSDDAAFVRWLALLPSPLSTVRTPLSVLGLLAWRSSVWIRLIYTLLALATIAQAEKLLRGRREMRPTERRIRAVICAGAALMLAGWGLQTAVGWIEPEVLAWPDAPCQIPARRITLPPQSPGMQLRTGRYGLYLLPGSAAVGLSVEAKDAAGAPLMLSPSAKVEASPTLQFSFSTQTPDSYFAIPEEGLVFRLSGAPEEHALPVLIQVYRLASGELLTEATVTESTVLLIEDVEVTVQATPLAHFEAVYNPGAPLQVAGIIAFALGVIGLWLRQAMERRKGQTGPGTDASLGPTN